jgi:hypothetical protein
MSSKPSLHLMNQQLFRIGIFVVIISAVIGGGMYSAQPQLPTGASTSPSRELQSLLSVPKPTPPIRTEIDAVHSAVHVKGVAASLRNAQKQASYKGWVANAERNPGDGAWDVHIRSTGTILPSYSCRVSFTDLGQLIKRSGGALIDCRYAK